MCSTKCSQEVLEFFVSELYNFVYAHNTFYLKHCITLNLSHEQQKSLTRSLEQLLDLNHNKDVNAYYKTGRT